MYLIVTMIQTVHGKAQQGLRKKQCHQRKNMYLTLTVIQTIRGKAQQGLPKICMLNNPQKYRVQKCPAVNLQSVQQSVKRLVRKANKYQVFGLKLAMAMLKTHLLRSLGKISAVQFSNTSSSLRRKAFCYICGKPQSKFICHLKTHEKKCGGCTTFSTPT